MTTEMHQLSPGDVARSLGSDCRLGLTESEADQRLLSHGPNKLRQSPPTPAWRRFLKQLQDPLVVLLIIAAAISTIVWYSHREETLPFEAIAILAIIVLNATLGFTQEERAEQALAALRRMSAPEAKVVRDGHELRIPSDKVVPGDLLMISEGDTIPADARLIDAAELQTMEASLTGESAAVRKDIGPIEGAASLGDRLNMVFSGTTAVYGHGRALVTATGMNTELGKIAGLLHETPTESTPLQKGLDRIGKWLGKAVLLIAVVVVGSLLISERPLTVTSVLNALLFGVALAVAAVPEGLAAIVTVVLSIGVQRMARRGAIIRKLPAVETLGSATVIASDKTGTLTRNEMTVRALTTHSGLVELTGAEHDTAGAFSGNGAIPQNEVRNVLEGLTLNNNSSISDSDGKWSIIGDPTEAALLIAARTEGIDKDELNSRFPRVREITFSSDRKMMSTLNHDEAADTYVLWTKGAPDVVLGKCTGELNGSHTCQPLTDERREEIQNLNASLSGNALRTLALAQRTLPAEDKWQDREADQLERDLNLVGLVGMIDPPRPEAVQAVKTAREAGIRSIMITGDHPSTAAAIAAEVGIVSDGKVITGTEIEQMSPSQLEEAAATVSVFARVSPSHKLRIVKALQTRSAIVAMTGDGVNDAPALKAADIGVAMGITGTDVSREAADVVLTDDNFATIVIAVEEGRAIFSNIRKFLRYLLSSNFGEVLTIFFAVLFADQLGFRIDNHLVMPLLAAQILWINLMTDGAPALALGMDPAEPGIMRKSPRPPDEPVITRDMWITVALVGAVMAIGTLLVFDASLPGGLIPGDRDVPYARTMAFTTLVLFQLFNAFVSRSSLTSTFTWLRGSHYLIGATSLSLLFQVLVVYLPLLQRGFQTVPLTLGDWGVCAAIASSVLWVMEIEKWFARRQQKNSVP